MQGIRNKHIWIHQQRKCAGLKVIVKHRDELRDEELEKSVRIGKQAVMERGEKKRTNRDQEQDVKMRTPSSRQVQQE